MSNKKQWGFFVERDGKDLILQNVWATAFGGDDDPQDSGETASGIKTKGNPNLVGCALPLPRNIPALSGSPLPRLPWKHPIEVTDPKTGAKIICPIIDLGPAKGTGNAIDLTVAAAKCFKSNASARNFKMRVNVRIPNGMKYYPNPNQSSMKTEK